MSSRRLVGDRSYVLEFEDTFQGSSLDRSFWIPHYLPQWSGRDAAAARYRLENGVLKLRIEADQPPWCPELDGDVRVSSFQTGVFAGPLGSTVGQHRFSDRAVVREEQREARLYTPCRGLIEVRMKAIADPRNMVALWMIGFEDTPDRSAEICVAEIFGRDVGSDRVAVGMGIHPFGDPGIEDDFERVPLDIDAREFHDYSAEWREDRVVFRVDGQAVKTVGQSPDYPMQLMLSVYEFPEPGSAGGTYPKEFVVDRVNGYRLDA